MLLYRSLWLIADLLNSILYLCEQVVCRRYARKLPNEDYILPDLLVVFILLIITAFFNRRTITHWCATFSKNRKKFKENFYN